MFDLGVVGGSSDFLCSISMPILTPGSCQWRRHCHSLALTLIPFVVKFSFLCLINYSQNETLHFSLTPSVQVVSYAKWTEILINPSRFPLVCSILCTYRWKYVKTTFLSFLSLVWEFSRTFGVQISVSSANITILFSNFAFIVGNIGFLVSLKIQ